jgi:hypothetical protein
MVCPSVVNRFLIILSLELVLLVVVLATGMILARQPFFHTPSLLNIILRMCLVLLQYFQYFFLVMFSGTSSWIFI